MVELRFNNMPIPTVLTVGNTYNFKAFLNGVEVLPFYWSVTVQNAIIAHGFSTEIQFTPNVAEPHSLYVRIRNEYGLFNDILHAFNVDTNNGKAVITVNWSKLTFLPGEALEAVIEGHDGFGFDLKEIKWSLYYNGSFLFEGEGKDFNYINTLPGLYRLKGSARGNTENEFLFDSSILVEGFTLTRHTTPVSKPEGTLVYLGAVYSKNINIAGGTASYLPYPLSSTIEELYLLPGTTHWSFELDPDCGEVDDEIVVRTSEGNWCYKGIQNGLAGEDVGYDYRYMPEFVPAPADKRLPLAIDVFKVHGASYQTQTCRIRVHCWRLTDNIYRYQRCTSSATYAGGEGRRNRKWAVLFTELEVKTDTYSTLNRLGTGNAIVSYKTTPVTTVPLMTLNTKGEPHPAQAHTGMFYTDSNLYAYYEADNAPELGAKAVAAIESIRPCCISLLTFNNSKPLINNSIQKIKGKILLFLLDGAAYAGSYVTARIYKSSGYVDIEFPIQQTYYANENDTLLKVAEAFVDITDNGFDQTGVAVDILVDESDIILPPPSYVAPPVEAPQFIYTKTYGPGVRYAGACYSRPEYVPALDEQAVLADFSIGCHDNYCGPRTYHCYTAVDAPNEAIAVPQPFGSPAPFVAKIDYPARCYKLAGNAVQTYDGHLKLANYTGENDVILLQYDSDALCGHSYLYQACTQGHGYNNQLIVVYPAASTPHQVIEYQGLCYSNQGTITDYGTRKVIAASTAEPAYNCTDTVCVPYNASGSVVTYYDVTTGIEVPVLFENLNAGIAHYGVVPEKEDNWPDGLHKGNKEFFLTEKTDYYFYTINTAGKLMVQIKSLISNKALVIKRNQNEMVYPLTGGKTNQLIDVEPSDQLLVRFPAKRGLLPQEYRNLKLQVQWYPVDYLPRLYHTAVWNFNGAGRIIALGFCAYTARDKYVYYNTIPFKGSMPGTVNPEGIVTVKDASNIEYLLLAVHSVGNDNLFLPINCVWYNNQVLTGPLTFKFYAGREIYGAHGEMDVWMNVSGSFPTTLKAGTTTLQYSQNSYRRNASPVDARRNAYRVG